MSTHWFKPCPKCRGHVVFVNSDGGVFKKKLLRGPYLWCTACDWVLDLGRRA
jgi:hypothetical protein